MTKRYVQFGTFIGGIWQESGDEIDMTDKQAELYIATGQVSDLPPEEAPEEVVEDEVTDEIEDED